jgi:hypothetical protein
MERYIELGEQYLRLLTMVDNVSWQPNSIGGIKLTLRGYDPQTAGYIKGFFAASTQAFGSTFESYVNARIRQTYPQA